MNGGGLAAEEMGGGEGHAPRLRGAGRGVNHAPASCECRKSHPGCVFAGGGGVVPTGFAEGEQDRGIGDADAVIGNGDAMCGGVGRGSAGGVGVDIETGSSGAAGVLQELGEDRAEAIGEEFGDAVDGVAVDTRGNGLHDG